MTPRSGKRLSVDEMEDFKSMLPDLIHELTYNGHHKAMPDVNQHLAKVRVIHISHVSVEEDLITLLFL